MTAPQGLVFRDAEVWQPGATVLRQVVRDLQAAQAAGGEEGLLRALLSAGALETALADAGAEMAVTAPAAVDRVARAYWCNDTGLLAGVASQLASWPVPARLRLSRPEGFAYYGLVPRDFAEAGRAVAGAEALVTVVGVRTVGTTLAAVLAAALDGDVARLTVRPQGHPFDRAVVLDAEQAALVERRAAGRFIVVDEGPGLSGSSLLASAEALVGRGVSASRVTLLGTRVVDPSSLVTRDGAARWTRFASVAAPPRPLPGQDLSGGQWRRLFWSEPEDWPAAWMERAKARSADGRWLLKFEGLGSWGAAVHGRALALAERGWGPWPVSAPDGRGVVIYPWLSGAPFAGAVTPALATDMAHYAADRSLLFPAEPDHGGAPLEEMARHNVEVEAGVRLPAGWSLPCERPAIVDGRMMPHEWIRDGERVTKVDGAAHGDDHLYPGPCDVAWDLAGAVVEWSLDDQTTTALLDAYRRRSGDDARRRLARYQIAYAAFRAASCAMAVTGAGPDEARRLLAARERYRAALQRSLRAPSG
jgi:hypothetical protein